MRGLAVAFGLLAACTTSPERAPQTCSTGSPVCDPVFRCVQPADCHVDNDCPSGLDCDENRITASVCGGTASRVCVPRQIGFLDQFQLIDGFRVRTMEMAVVTEQPLTLAWQPLSAEIVACAVFSCAPQVRARDGTLPRTPQDTVIHNFDKCAAWFDQVEAGQGSIRLTRREAYTGGENNCSDPAMFDTRDRVFDDLLAACWAYSGTEIVAASEIQRLGPDLLREFESTYGTCADGVPCYRGDLTATFGICQSGVCQARCTTEADCLLAAKIQDPQLPDPETCPWRCEEVPFSTAKVCVPIP